MRTWHIAWKDVRIWTRDIAALGVLLGMPVVLILILGSALGGMGANGAAIKVAVVNLDESVMRPIPGDAPTSSRGLPHSIGTEFVEIVKDSQRINEIFDVEYAEDAEDARGRVAAGELTAAVIIPETFTADITADKPAEMILYKDPGQQTAAGIWESVVRSLGVQYSAAAVAAKTSIQAAQDKLPADTVNEQTLGILQYNAIQASTAEAALDVVVVEETQAAPDVELRALDFYGLSMTAMFLMFGAMFGAFSTIKERREQTLSRLLATPTSGLTVTSGKMLGIFVLGILQFVVLFGFTRYAFGVQWGDDLLAIFVVAAAEVLAVTGLAVLIGTLAKTERGAGGIGPLVIQVQALIGGAFFTISALPAWLQPIRYFSVIGWTMEGWQRIQMGGAGVGDVLGPVGALVGFGALFLAISAALTGVRR